ncbi:MAG: hypothetical protein EZS28_032067 [Streblomastix strix]|uniref:Ubiquitin-like domain-containing protein n=1 Tax=Streblomastix strix TaxID=222440 RepID=A0A5J4UQH0_9EUKA|nr:MAG: hypothetical protein EZS28_032067 [Streblomastix strix]
MQIREVGALTTLQEVARQILSIIGMRMAKLSIILKFNNALQLTANQEEVSGYNSEIYIEDICKRACLRAQIESSGYSVRNNKDQLDTNKLLSEFNSNELNNLIIEKPVILIEIQTRQCKRKVGVNEDITIIELKKMVQQFDGAHPQRQILKWKDYIGKEEVLQNNVTIAEYWTANYEILVLEYASIDISANLKGKTYDVKNTNTNTTIKQLKDNPLLTTGNTLGIMKMNTFISFKCRMG